jgi:HlyD family secretion protein
MKCFSYFNRMAQWLSALTASIILFTQACSSGNDQVDAYGNFESTEIMVSAQMPGKLLSFKIDEGDYIHEDSCVGIIDTLPVAIKMAQLMAQEKVTLAKRHNLDAQLRVQEEQRANLARELKRIESLLKENAATPQQYDDLEGKLKVTDAQTASLKSQYNLIMAELSVLDAQLAEIKNQMEKCFIINPVEGTVLVKYAEQGEIVTPGKSLYKIANLKEMELKVFVSGAQLADIAIGDSVKVRIDKGKKDYYMLNGVICWIADEVEFTPKIIQTKDERVNMVYAVKIKVKNDGSIKIGMPGEAVFQNPKK